MITHRELFTVAWPYTLALSTSFIIQAVDSSMVAPLGVDALAAMTVAATSAYLPNAITMGLITSVQKRAAADRGAANAALSSGVLLALLLASPCALLYAWLASPIAGLFTTGRTAEAAASYLRVFSPVFVVIALNYACNGYWIGIFKSKSRLMVTLVLTAVNVIANLILIPRYGLNAAAMGSLAATLVALSLNLALAWRREGYRWQTPRWSDLAADARLVAGVSLNQISLGLTLNAAVFLIGLIGTDALAVANVVGVLSTPILYVGIGYGTAVGSFLVRARGALDFAEARRVGTRGAIQVISVSAIFSLLIWLGGASLRRWYFGNGALFALASRPLAILGVLYLIDGLCCLLQRYLFVSDGIRRSFLIMTGVQWCVFFPVAYLGITSRGWGYDAYLVLHLACRTLVTALLGLAFLRLNTKPIERDGN